MKIETARYHQDSAVRLLIKLKVYGNDIRADPEPICKSNGSTIHLTISWTLPQKTLDSSQVAPKPLRNSGGPSECWWIPPFSQEHQGALITSWPNLWTVCGPTTFGRPQWVWSQTHLPLVVPVQFWTGTPTEGGTHVLASGIWTPLHAFTPA